MMDGLWVGHHPKVHYLDGVAPGDPLRSTVDWRGKLMLTSRENLHFCSTRSGVEPLLVEERNRERWIGELGEMEVGPCQPLFFVSRAEKWLLKRTLFEAMIGLEPLCHLFR